MESLTKHIILIANHYGLEFGRVYRNKLVASTTYKIWGVRSGDVQGCADHIAKLLNVSVTVSTRHKQYGTLHDIVVKQPNC